MNNRQSVRNRVRDLEVRAQALRQQAGAQGELEHDNLWMSSLDIIGELLNVVQQLTTDVGKSSEQMRLACPHCHALVGVSYDVVAEAAARCPACGENVLLTNPT